MLVVWIVICIATILIELATPSALISIWLSVGAAISALLTLFDVPIWVQIVAFIIVSLISMIIVRPIATRYLRGNTVATNADRCIGEIGIVTQSVSKDEWGEVKVNGSVWHAVPVEDTLIEVHEKVKVIAIEGAKLLVRRVS